MEEDDDASEGSAATEEPTRLWLRRVYLHYASRNDDRNMSSLTLPTFRLLMRDLQVAQQLPGGAVAADVLFHAATRNEARMDFGSFAEALALLARRLYPDLGPKAAFAELLEHDVATRVGARGAPPFAVEASMRACAATLESIVLPLRQVWLGYAVRPGLSFPPRGRVGSPAQSAQISAAPTPWAASTGIDGDEGMPLECFLAFCADAGLVTHMGHHNLASIFVDSLEGMYDPSLDSGSEQPVLSFPAFQVAIVRLAAHLWDMRAHPSVRASPWPRPLHGLFMLILLHTRERELESVLSRFRARYRVGLEHEQLLSAGWKGLLRKFEALWHQSGSADHFAPIPEEPESGLDMLGVRASPAKQAALAGKPLVPIPIVPGADEPEVSPSISWPPTSARPASGRAQRRSAGFGKAAPRSAEGNRRDDDANSPRHAETPADDEAADAVADGSLLREAMCADMEDALRQSSMRMREANQLQASRAAAAGERRAQPALASASQGAPSPTAHVRAVPMRFERPRSPPPPRLPAGVDDSAEAFRTARTPEGGSPPSARIAIPGRNAVGGSPDRLVPPDSITMGASPTSSPTRARPETPRSVRNLCETPLSSPRRPLATSQRMAVVEADDGGPGRRPAASPSTTAGALEASATGSYRLRRQQADQLEHRHRARWSFGATESRLHETRIAVARRATERLRSLEGVDLDSPRVPRTPKQWIAVEQNFVPQPPPQSRLR